MKNIAVKFALEITDLPVLRADIISQGQIA